MLGRMEHREVSACSMFAILTLTLMAFFHQVSFSLLGLKTGAHKEGSGEFTFIVTFLINSVIIFHNPF